MKDQNEYITISFDEVEELIKQLRSAANIAESDGAYAHAEDFVAWANRLDVKLQDQLESNSEQ